MITSKLQGGLGNQMFQIAAAFSLSKEINTTCAFDFEQCYTPNQGFTSDKYSSNIFKKVINQKINYENFKIFGEQGFRYNELPLVDDICLDGYFQSEKYFKKHRNELISLFNFDNEERNDVVEFLKKINFPITVVQVRRGDYLSKTHYHSVCSKEYFLNSMRLFPNNNFIFISDDIEWCKENFSGKNIFFSDFNSEIHDLHLMMECNNLIISNSSFGWWGAWINEKKEKIVVAPKVWFGPSGPDDIEDVIPQEWLKL